MAKTTIPSELIADNAVGITQLNVSDGSSGQFLKTDGSGTLSFATVSTTTALDDIATGDAACTLATSAGNITIDAQGSDTDIIFKGTDGSSDITALTLDMSDAGKALFNAGFEANKKSQVTVTSASHVNGFKIINSQAGGYGSALDFVSERSDDNSLVVAARINTIGGDSWNTNGSTDSHLLFKTVDGNSIGERLRIQSGGGISFNGDTAAANALDDYEEGTWTPTINDGVIANAAGYYTKIGRMVTVTYYYVLTTLGSSGGTVIVGGLPFSSGNSGDGMQSVGSVLCRYFSKNQIVSYVGNNTHNLQYYNNTTTDFDAITFGEIEVSYDNDFAAHGTHTYFTG